MPSLVSRMMSESRSRSGYSLLSISLTPLRAVDSTGRSVSRPLLSMTVVARPSMRT